MKNLHIISHTHWDREWYRTFQQFRLQLVHLIDNLLVILDSDPNYLHYMLDGQTVVLEDYLQMRMENFAKLQQHIQENRILIGPWYVLPDEFLVSPEATVRNLLAGKQICELFGQRMMIGYLPDPFGHISQMPQILREFGIDTAVLWRGVRPELPTAFTWQAPDGSQVLLGHLYFGYGNIAHWPVEDKARSMQLLEEAANRLEPHSNTSQYLMMQGTDHLEPHPATSENIAFYNENNPDGNIAVHSTLPAYLAALSQEIKDKNILLPVHTGELRDPQKAHILPGVLSTRMWIKQRNWEAQTRMERWVEPFCAWAEILERGQDAFSPVHTYQSSERIADPGNIIREAWKTLMKNHAHDSICGCSIDRTHEDMIPRFEKVDQINEQLIDQSLEAIVSHINTMPKKKKSEQLAITVFNASPVKATGIVHTDLILPDDIFDYKLRDENGKILEKVLNYEGFAGEEEDTYSVEQLSNLVERVKEHGYRGQKLVDVDLEYFDDEEAWHIFATLSDSFNSEDSALNKKLKQIINKLAGLSPETQVNVFVSAGYQAELMFTAEDVPAFGYKTYWLSESGQYIEEEDEDDPIPAGSGQSLSIENRWLKVTVSSDDESFTVLDKRNGAVYESQGLLVSIGDRGDEYNYTPTPDDDMYLIDVREISLLPQAGSQMIIINFDMILPEGLDDDTMDRSKEISRNGGFMIINLPKNQAYLNIGLFFNNNSSDHRLEMRFDVDFPIKKVLYDGHFDIVERPIALPEFDESWSEHPRPEVPQCAFVDVIGENQGLMISNQGLPEVAVIPYEESTSSYIAVTLLRSVGWLSRSDLFNRKGHAGPSLETPDAQETDHDMILSLRLIPHDGQSQSARQYAYSFQVPFKSVVSAPKEGHLPSSGTMIEVDHAAFYITAVKEAEDQQGYIVRGYNQSDEPIHVNMRSHMLANRAARVRLDEAFVEDLTLGADGTVSFDAKPKEIVTIYFGLKA